MPKPEAAVRSGRGGFNKRALAGPLKFVLRAHAVREMPHLRENLFCYAAEIAAVHAGRSKSKTVNSQVGGQTCLSPQARDPSCNCEGTRRSGGQPAFSAIASQSGGKLGS